jgi:NDP-sugar pyrophosphorylase family protein
LLFAISFKGNMMHLVIPMSGLGSRFVAAGYKTPKPLIEVNGKRILSWVMHSMPEENTILICRDEHIENTDMAEVLAEIAPKATVRVIKGHKQGPVFAVKQAFDLIDDDEPVIVSYCDYYMQWDYEEFKQQALARGCEGAIPCYTGFHPHLIPAKNLYASCQVDNNQGLIEIREKYSFEEDKTLAHHSPGVYYFKSGAILKKYFQKMIDMNIALNGEFYCSLVYNLLVEDGFDVWVPDNVEKFCQWGTPEDLQEYEYWVKTIKEFSA